MSQTWNLYYIISCIYTTTDPMAIDLCTVLVYVQKAVSPNSLTFFSVLLSVQTKPCLCSSIKHRKPCSTGLPTKFCCENLQIQDGVQNGRHFDWIWYFKDKIWWKHQIATNLMSYERGENFLQDDTMFVGYCDNWGEILSENP